MAEVATTLESALKEASEKRSFAGNVEDEEKTEAEETEAQTEAEALSEQAAATEEESENEAAKEQLAAEQPTFKYSSHEEAEKGYREAEKRMRDAIGEAESYKAEIAKLQSQVVKDGKSGVLTEDEVAVLQPIFEGMVTDINTLDAGSEAYLKELAKVWSKGFGTAFRTIGEIKEARAAEERSVETGRERALRYAFAEASKAGLDMEVKDDVPSVDYELFMKYALDSLHKGKSVEERTAWTIKKVLDVKSAISGKKQAAVAKTQATQTKNRVLERGVGGMVSKSKEAKPLTISEALSRTERRI